MIERSSEIRLTVVEDMVLDARIGEQSVSKIPEKVLREFSLDIIARASAISGAALPLTDYAFDVLESEVREFLLMSAYKDFSIKEILLALRLNTKTGLTFPNSFEWDPVQISGKNVSVDFIAKVLNVYSILRALLDRKIQNFIDGYPV